MKIQLSERDEKICQLWNYSGLSCSQIANELDGRLSRSAIAGIISRLRDKGVELTIRGVRKPSPQQRQQIREGIAKARPNPKIKIKRVMPSNSPVDGDLNLEKRQASIVSGSENPQPFAYVPAPGENNVRCCQWPLWSGEEKTGNVCGDIIDPKHPKYSYCAFHYKRAYVPKYDRGLGGE